MSRSQQPKHQDKKSMMYPPSRFVTEDGQKWRLCAGCAVLNSNNHLLVGERVGRNNAWQTPQGGVDDAWEGNENRQETILDAACRELYEETGLIINQHVIPEKDLQLEPVRYRTEGTASWLTKSGFVGQELHWCVFRCIDSRGDNDPTLICDLGGKDGEEAEFTKVKWSPIDWVVQQIWAAKRKPYETLRDALTPHCQEWSDQCAKLDFTGKWSRDSSQCTGVVQGLMARGMAAEQAESEALKPYIQIWNRQPSEALAWKVATFNDDGSSMRHEIVYKVGCWEETFPGAAVILGGDSNRQNPATVRRRTAFVAEPHEKDDDIGIAHSTVSKTPLGTEESRRFLTNDCLVLRRTFWPTHGDVSPCVSTEVFVRQE